MHIHFLLVELMHGNCALRTYFRQLIEYILYFIYVWVFQSHRSPLMVDYYQPLVHFEWKTKFKNSNSNSKTNNSRLWNVCEKKWMMVLQVFRLKFSKIHRRVVSNLWLLIKWLQLSDGTAKVRIRFSMAHHLIFHESGDETVKFYVVSFVRLRTSSEY